MTDYQLNVLEEIRNDCDVCMDALTVLMPKAGNAMTRGKIYQCIYRTCEEMKRKLYDWVEDDNDDEQVRVRYETLRLINNVMKVAVALVEFEDRKAL